MKPEKICALAMPMSTLILAEEDLALVIGFVYGHSWQNQNKGMKSFILT
jgi:hypothetical protein